MALSSRSKSLHTRRSELEEEREEGEQEEEEEFSKFSCSSSSRRRHHHGCLSCLVMSGRSAKDRPRPKFKIIQLEGLPATSGPSSAQRCPLFRLPQCLSLLFAPQCPCLSTRATEKTKKKEHTSWHDHWHGRRSPRRSPSQRAVAVNGARAQPFLCQSSFGRAGTTEQEKHSAVYCSQKCSGISAVVASLILAFEGATFRLGSCTDVYDS